MQNTRLNTLVDLAISRGKEWLQNPWRRLSLILIGLFFGFYIANAISTVSGQTAELDILGAALATGFTEIISWLVYRSGNKVPLADVLNAFKVGLIYGYALEAFKLGS
ncbi:MAG: DUF565 domain-containing protein [Cyanobacteria bacterium]|nr:DUF565 domain-containing protein [Cyanobacteriota bacterium]